VKVIEKKSQVYEAFEFWNQPQTEWPDWLKGPNLIRYQSQEMIEVWSSRAEWWARAKLGDFILHDPESNNNDVWPKALFDERFKVYEETKGLPIKRIKGK
jgi:hypothetical protein